MDVEKIRN